MKTYTIRLFPSNQQVEELKNLSYLRNTLWNTLIDIEQYEYITYGRIIHNYELDKRITELRKKNDLSILNSKACQRISKEVYSSYQSFLKLIKKDNTVKPPQKIKDANIFHTIIYNQIGWFFQNDKIVINQIPFLYKSNISNIFELNIKEIRVKYKNKKWLCDICIDEKIRYLETITQENRILAIDLGLKSLGTCVDNEGKVIVIRNTSKKISKYYTKQIAKIQNKISKKKKYSKKYNILKRIVNKCYHKKNKQVKQTLHIQSKQLLNMNYHTIVIGDLSIKKLMQDKKNKSIKISKSFYESNISMFLLMLSYKSYSYKTNILKINEQYTTQINALTGKQFITKIGLGDRSVKLSDNVEIDRDLNSAINILERYFNNHLASMAKPLDKTSVIHRFNLMNKPHQIDNPVIL